MRSGRGSQAKLGEILERVLKKAGLQHRFKQHQVLLAWKEIVGPANARHSRPVGVKDGVLLVECSNPAWAQTLTMLRGQIMEKISRLLGECPLREIHFRGVGRARKEIAEAESAEPPLPAEIMLRREEVERLCRIANEITEPPLRKKAEAALASLLRQRKWHEEQGNRPCRACGRLHRSPGAFCSSCRKTRARESA